MDLSGPPGVDLSREVQKLREATAYQQELNAITSRDIQKIKDRINDCSKQQDSAIKHIDGILLFHNKMSESLDALTTTVTGLRVFVEGQSRELEVRHRDMLAMVNALAELIAKLQARAINTVEDLNNHRGNEGILLKSVIGLSTVIGSLFLLIAVWVLPRIIDYFVSISR